MPTRIYIDDIPDPSYISRFQALGVNQYCIIYQGNVDPNAKTGVIDVDTIKAKIDSGASLGGGCSFKEAEIVVLDFEDPYMWPMMVGPEFSRTLDNGVHYTYDSINSNLIKAVTELKAAYPDKQWGYYSMPSIPGSICKEGDPIRMVTPSGMGTYITNASDFQIRNLKKHLTSSFRAVADASDFVSVSVYQIDKRDSDSLGLDRIDVLKSEIGADVCVNIAPDKPKFAWVAPVFFSFVNASGVNSGNSVFDIIPIKEVVTESILPCKERGVDNFFIWLASNYRINQITRPLSSGGHVGQKEWFNKNFLAGTGADATDDEYWSAPHMVAAIKTIYTDWLYRFCKSIVEAN